MYFAALRPGEVKALRRDGCYLPASGGGRLTLSRSRPQSNRRWTDSGEGFDDQGLKHRAEDDTGLGADTARADHDRAGAYRGVRDRGRWAAVQDGYWRHDLRPHLGLGGCPDAGPDAGAGCLSARGEALRPASRRGLALAERWVAATEVANRAGHTAAEGVGFEPTRTRQRPNGFQERRWFSGCRRCYLPCCYLGLADQARSSRVYPASWQSGLRSDPRIIRMPITRVTAEARAVRRSVSPRTAPGTRRR